MDRLTPAWPAIDLVPQCVSPFDLECKVSWMIHSIVSAGIDGFGPRSAHTSWHADTICGIIRQWMPHWCWASRVGW